jgi:hypothetical protein
MRALAYVNWGRWVADCPRPFCPNAEHFGRSSNGHLGGLTGNSFRCSHCGLRCDADWPPNVDDIDYLLSQRPVPGTRNWRPGETLWDLIEENAVHGVIPAPMSIVGDHIVERELVTAARLSITGGQ